MCNDRSVKIWLAAAAAFAAGAIALIIAAAVANNSFFGAWASPGLMLGAAAASFAAAAALGTAAAAMQDYYDCLRRTGQIGDQCGGALANWMTNIAALQAVLTAQGGACLAAAATAWIPWGGTPPMYVILGTLISQVPLIASLGYFIAELNKCLPQIQLPPTQKQALVFAPLWFPIRTEGSRTTGLLILAVLPPSLCVLAAILRKDLG